MQERSASTLLAAAAAAFVLLALVVLAGAPLATADFWWHLKMGEVYVAEGPRPAADPMLHTAHADAPIPHEWLFSVGMHAVDRIAGFWGLRLAHALAVASCLLLLYAVFRRERAAAELTFLATLCFAALALGRLMMLRPDLVSIPATFAIYALVIAPERAPAWRRVAASSLLFLVWANVHGLFAIGLILILVALLGLGARAVLRLRLAPDVRANLWHEDRGRAQRLAAAFGMGFLASCVNPRGIEQHLTFFAQSTTGDIWSVQDEWTHFDPLDLAVWGSAPTGVVADLLLLGLPVAALVGVVRFWRRPGREALEAVDPVRFSLGFAGLCALLIAIRFTWMGGFALLALLRIFAPLRTSHVRTGVAALTAVLAVALVLPVLRQLDARFPSAAAYLETPYTGYYVAGVRFLRQTRLEGNLFNSYTEGGFFGYWLAPRLRTFVDGRTDHYTNEVLQAYYDLRDLRLRPDGSSPFDVLAARGVDVFFGVGLPLAMANRPEYTTVHLERVLGWIQVFRAVDQAIYLRRYPGNRKNVERVVAYYAARGIRFDPQRGFDPRAAASANPGWAITNQVVPFAWRQLVASSAAQTPEARFAALDEQALVLTLLGNYEAALALDNEALSLRPEALAPRRRQVLALLRLGEVDAALDAARALRGAAPNDPRHLALEDAAARLAVRGAGGPSAVERIRISAALPLLDAGEVRRSLAGRYNPLLLKRR